jgi:glycerophosphoryl diester phosphodiesterase
MTAPFKPPAQSLGFFAKPKEAPLIIAHRGGSLEAPENTLAALRHGVACQASWQEIDVGLSADDACVVLHDDGVGRTTNGVGNLMEWPASHLTTLTAGRPQWHPEVRQNLARLGVHELPDFGDRYAEERVPTLEQALAVPGVRLMIELKPTIKPEILVRKVARAVAEAGMGSRVAIGSFDPPLVAMAAQLAPELPRIGILEDPLLLPLMLDLQVQALAVDAQLMGLMRPQVPRGVALWTWTVYTLPCAQTLARAGADGLITDIPHQLVQAHRTGRLAR